MTPFLFYTIDIIIILLYNIFVIILLYGGAVPLFKKLLSVLLSAILLLSMSSAVITVIAEETNNTETNTDTNTNQNPEQGEGETQEPITITIGVITEPGTNKTGVILRSDAGTTAAKVYLLSDGTSVTVNGSKDDINSKVNTATQKVYVWYNITYTLGTTSYTGYVREDLITVTTHTITPPNPDEEEDIVVKPFEEQLAEFPENYHPYLTALHEKYPNWIFTADEITLTYQEAIAIENVFPRKLVENQYYSWRSMESDYYNWNTGSYIVTDGRWYGASREVIAYYMDPRNFLNTNDAYIFMKQSYDANSQSIVGLRELLKGRFLANNYVDPNDLLYGGDFAYVIMEAAKQSGVSPYILAATIIQEQGTNGSKFAHGVQYEVSPGNYVTVYNYFNFGVSGTTEADKLKKGAKYAYDAGWTTRSAAIIGGAKKYADGYVNSNPSKPYYNQDTYFYKNYNILNPSKIYHQYAQNVADQVSTASFLRKMYVDNTTTYMTFRIPVYKNNTLPETPAVAPVKNANQNNYYFNTIEVEGLTPSFSRYVYSYALQVEGDTTVYVNVPETAEIISDMTFNLFNGDNKVVLTVKSATGYTNDYVINVNALNDCVLTITTEKPTPPPPPEEGDGDGDGEGNGGGEDGTIPDPDDPDNPDGGGNNGEDPNDPDAITPPVPTIKKGDVNNDGKISLSDLAAVRLHLLELSILTGDALIAADCNGDGVVSLSDLAAIRLHLLELIVIE